MALKMKRSAVAGKVPQVSDLDLGELALNTRDGRLFFKTDDGTPAVVEAAMTGHTHALAEITDLPAGELVTTAGTQSLSNKTLASPKLALGADATLTDEVRASAVYRSTCIDLYTCKHKYNGVQYGMETRALVSGQFLDR